MDYYDKYLKYKNKYLLLKNQIGGLNIALTTSSNKKDIVVTFTDDEIRRLGTKNSILSIQTFLNSNGVNPTSVRNSGNKYFIDFGNEPSAKANLANITRLINQYLSGTTSGSSGYAGLAPRVVIGAATGVAALASRGVTGTAAKPASATRPGVGAATKPPSAPKPSARFELPKTTGRSFADGSDDESISPLPRGRPVTRDGGRTFTYEREESGSPSPSPPHRPAPAAASVSPKVTVDPGYLPQPTGDDNAHLLLPWACESTNIFLALTIDPSSPIGSSLNGLKNNLKTINLAGKKPSASSIDPYYDSGPNSEKKFAGPHLTLFYIHFPINGDVYTWLQSSRNRRTLNNGIQRIISSAIKGETTYHLTSDSYEKFTNFLVRLYNKGNMKPVQDLVEDIAGKILQLLIISVWGESAGTEIELFERKPTQVGRNEKNAMLDYLKFKNKNNNPLFTGKAEYRAGIDAELAMSKIPFDPHISIVNMGPKNHKAPEPVPGDRRGILGKLNDDETDEVYFRRRISDLLPERNMRVLALDEDIDYVYVAYGKQPEDKYFLAL